MAKQSQILQFRPPSSATPAVEIAIAKRPVAPIEVAEPKTPCIDLSGRPKLICLIGSGHTGKTTIARWLGERTQAEGRQTMLAAMDPVNRTLANYADGVEQPATSDPLQAARWLSEFVRFAAENKYSAIVDFGGGDTSLANLLDTMPELPDALEDAGMAAVAFYTVAPRIDDLAPFLSLGFRPKATAFICNMGVADLTVDRTRAFTPLLEQPAMREATEAGARVIWMPRLDGDVVAHIEMHRVAFGAAAKGAKNTGPFRQLQVRTWLKRMDEAFAPVASWLP